MWVVVNDSSAAFTVHMESTSQQPSYSPTASVTSPRQAASHANTSPVARASKSPRKLGRISRSRSSSSSSTSTSSNLATSIGKSESSAGDTCAPSQTLCRYANKKCTNPRAVKRTGGLHTFCAMHRENANRNQRRLDLRKRLQKQAMQASALLDRRQTRSVDLNHLQIPRDEYALTFDISHSDALYEPHATPTSLCDEDVATLITLFASAEQLSHDPRCLDDIPMPREPRFDFSRDAHSGQ